MTLSLHFTIPASLWMSANQRLHWADEAKRKKSLRQLGAATAKQAGLHDVGTCAVAAYIGYPRGGRADPANERVTKPLIDGLVDAGVWPDDDHTHVIGPTPLRDKASGQPGVHTVRLVLTRQEVPW